jgi:fructose-specific phosphotransferase system component IIB
MDSSLLQADISNNSVVNKESLKRYLNKSYQILESRLEQKQQFSSSDEQAKSGRAIDRYISNTDPDASVTRRGKGKSTLKYQTHRAVDQEREVVTATEVTPGEVHESHCLESLICFIHT